jgi:RNA polymerase sigma-70 factor (ECF subfamily)
LCGFLYAKYGAGPPEPEDIAQAAFAKFAGLKDPFSIRNPKAFLRRIAGNLVIDLRRQQYTQRRYTEEKQHGAANDILDEIDAEHVLLARERHRILLAAITGLPQPARRLLIQHRVHNLTYAEVARRNKMPPTTVKRVIADAMAECVEVMHSVYKDKSGGN